MTACHHLSKKKSVFYFTIQVFDEIPK